MVAAAAIVASEILGGLALLQAGLVAGRPWGRLAWGGQHEVLPTRLRIGSAVSIVLYGVIFTAWVPAFPVPLPTSSTRSPGRTAASSTSASAAGRSSSAVRS